MPQASNVWEAPYVPVDDNEAFDNDAGLTIPARPVKNIVEVTNADSIPRGHGEPVVADMIRSAQIAAVGNLRRMPIRLVLAWIFGASAAIWGMIIIVAWLVTIE